MSYPRGLWSERWAVSSVSCHCSVQCHKKAPAARWQPRGLPSRKWTDTVWGPPPWLSSQLICVLASLMMITITMPCTVVTPHTPLSPRPHTGDSLTPWGASYPGQGRLKPRGRVSDVMSGAGFAWSLMSPFLTVTLSGSRKAGLHSSDSGTLTAADIDLGWARPDTQATGTGNCPCHTPGDSWHHQKNNWCVW